jgi:hypothetical protein
MSFPAADRVSIQTFSMVSGVPASGWFVKDLGRINR